MVGGRRTLARRCIVVGMQQCARWVVFLCAAVTAACGGDGNGVAQDAPAGPVDTMEVDAPVDAPLDAAMLSADAGGDATLLSMQGVYGTFATRSLPDDAIAYTVNSELWADGATKRRWLILPPGSAAIDNADQEHWVFPPGTRLVKEFTRDGKLVETRIIERVAVGGAPVYSMRTYVWNLDQTEAVLDTDGATDVAGTPHDAPSEAQCSTCHNAEAGKALGFSAVQLAPSILAMLSASGRLTVPLAAGATFGPTGTPEAVAALRYLHANCGHCHSAAGIAQGQTMRLRLDAASKAADQEPGWVTTVNVPAGNPAGLDRIDPMVPINSAVVTRPSLRGAGQMPQIATSEVDTAGVAILTAWVDSLTP